MPALLQRAGLEEPGAGVGERAEHFRGHRAGERLVGPEQDRHRDILETAAASKLGVVFTDGTALNMLASARMELNEFVYQPDGKWNSSMFNAVKGTFTFIGGKMAKAGNMRVNTTAATLGIRGTTAHIVIGADGSVRFSTLVEEKQ